MSLLNFLISNKDLPLNNLDVCRYIMDIKYEHYKPYRYRDDNLFIYCVSLFVVPTTICIITNYKITTVLNITDNSGYYSALMRTINYNIRTMIELLDCMDNYNYCDYVYKNKINKLLVGCNYDEITFGVFLPSKVKSSCSTIN